MEKLAEAREKLSKLLRTEFEVRPVTAFEAGERHERIRQELLALQAILRQ